MSAVEQLAPVMPVPLVFDVLGVPAPQGSKKPAGTMTLKGGKRVTRLVESSKKVEPWRKAVAAAARVAMGDRPPFACAVAVQLDFWMPRASGVRMGQLWQTTYPDRDKLERSTNDALKMGGVVDDDGLIVTGASSQRYVPHERGRRATTPTGARITVWPLGELEAAGVDVDWVPTLRPYTTAPTWEPIEPGRLL